MLDTRNVNGLHGQGPSPRERNDGRPVGEVTAGKLKLQLEWQGFKCALSGEELTPDNAEADHIIPIKHGGTNEMGNIQIVTAIANKAKGTLTQDAFVGMCCNVANTQRNEWGD